MNRSAVRDESPLAAPESRGARLVPPVAQLGPHVRLLLAALRDPRQCLALDEHQWHLLMSASRQARLQGTLAAQLRRERLLDRVPEPMRRHLDGALALAEYKHRMVSFEVETAGRVLRDIGVTPILLKGAAYIAQGSVFAEGRMPEDADLMVERAALARAEAALVEAGWRFEKLEPYDQHYYRAWTHELPPLRFPGHAAELDLHHTILPPLGRFKPDAAALVADAVPVADGTLKVLSGPDQVLHASAHLFHDSDCTNRLRDLHDIVGLVREHAARDADFWPRLWAHAERHQLRVPLLVALRFGRAWFDLALPPDVADRLDARVPGAYERWLLALIARVIVPGDPDGESTFATRTASRLLDLRAVWRRMPPRIVVYHAIRKALRRPPEPPAE